LRSAPLGIVTNELGVIVVDLALTHRDQRATTRFVTVIVEQTDFAEGTHVWFSRW
jgi:hypothetical protein